MEPLRLGVSMKKSHLILILCHFFILGCETQKQKRPKTKEVNYRIKKDSLRNVFNNMNDEKDYYYTKDINDIMS